MVQFAYPQPIWQIAMLVLDYDEHSGMLDHVTPPLIRTDPAAGAKYTNPFLSLGVRVAASFVGKALL